MAVAFAAPFVLGLVPAAAAALGGARDRRGHRDRPVGARARRGRPGDRGRRADRPRASCSSSPASRSSSSKLRGQVLRLTALGFALSFAIAVVVVARALQRGRARRDAAARGDHPVRDVARRARAGAQGRGRDLLDVRAADRRRRVDRRLRRDHPADALLLRRGRDRLDAAAAGRAARARRRRVRRGARAPSARCGSATTCCACRTRPRRSACAPRSCCSSASPRSPRQLGLRGHPRHVRRRRDHLAASTATR